MSQETRGDQREFKMFSQVKIASSGRSNLLQPLPALTNKDEGSVVHIILKGQSTSWSLSWKQTGNSPTRSLDTMLLTKFKYLATFMPELFLRTQILVFSPVAIGTFSFLRTVDSHCGEPCNCSQFLLPVQASAFGFWRPFWSRDHVS